MVKLQIKPCELALKVAGGGGRGGGGGGGGLQASLPNFTVSGHIICILR